MELKVEKGHKNIGIIDSHESGDSCGSSSVGRASAFQAECRRFEPGLPL